MTRTSWRLSAGLLLLGWAPALAGLDLGDKAPSLKIQEWVKGRPVKLEDGKGKNIYVVEFWATWCGWCRSSIPHLTQMQAKYKDKGVTFIAVSDEPPSVVKPFVNKMGEKMAYTVACDADQATARAYMKAAGIEGIPYVFVIDKDGSVAWHCHPTDQLEQVLDELLAGTFDQKAAQKKREQLAKLQTQFAENFQSANWDQALALAEQINKLRPDPAGYHLMRLRCLASKGDKEAALQAGKTFLREVDDAGYLNEAAWGLLTEERYGGQYNDLALAIAAKAYDKTDGQDWSIVDTYARAKFETGDVGGAIRLQRKAIELAEQAGARTVDELRRTLENYAKAANSER